MRILAAVLVAACAATTPPPALPAPPPAPAPAPTPIKIAPPADAEITQRSHALIEAFDNAEVTAVEAALAPAFVQFEGGSPRDREQVIASLKARKEGSPHIGKRTWEKERVVRKDDALVFIGLAHEVQAGNESHGGGYLYDGWYLLQWVRAGTEWRVQLWTWHKQSGEHEWWNDVFRKGRGFSHEPNRLLVDALRGVKPGTALDVAMGQGRNALYVASQGWKVTGVDISDEGLRIAREQAGKRKLALEAINANIDDWDFGTNRYDLVTLIYTPNKPKWIEKIKASLKKGGLFVLEGWGKTAGDSEDSWGFSAGELAKTFAGYEILRDELVEDVPDWAQDRGRLARFVARKR